MSHPARRDALRALLPAAGLDALLVTDLIDVRHLTGFTGSNAAAVIAADPGGDLLCTDGRYRVQAAEQCPGLKILVDRPSAPAGLVRIAWRARAASNASWSAGGAFSISRWRSGIDCGASFT